MFPKRPFKLPVINTSKPLLQLQKYRHAATANPPSRSVFYSRIKEPSPYSPRLSVSESIKAVHYTPKRHKLQEMEEHAQLTEKDNNRLQKNLREEVTVLDGHKQHNKALI